MWHFLKTFDECLRETDGYRAARRGLEEILMTRPKGFRHQWWCPRTPTICECLPEWVTYQQDMLDGQPSLRPVTSIIEGPPCAECQGTAERMEDDGRRVGCVPGEGQRHPRCRGNGGGRMSPRQMAAWLEEHAIQGGG